MLSERTISFLKAMTICLPLLIGVFRIKKIDTAYHPFIWYLAVGTITEILSYIQISNLATTNAVISNCFAICEWLLLVWQFKRWGLFVNHTTAFRTLALLLTLLWVIENVFYGNLNKYSPYFRETCCLFLVLMAINIINYTIINDNKNILKNPRFLICVGFVIFFIYKMIYEWAYQIGNIKSYFAVTTRIINWMGNVNAAINLLFMVAMLFIPSKTYAPLKRT